MLQFKCLQYSTSYLFNQQFYIIINSCANWYCFGLVAKSLDHIKMQLIFGNHVMWISVMDYSLLINILML